MLITGLRRYRLLARSLHWVYEGRKKLVKASKKNMGSRTIILKNAFRLLRLSETLDLNDPIILLADDKFYGDAERRKVS